MCNTGAVLTHQMPEAKENSYSYCIHPQLQLGQTSEVVRPKGIVISFDESEPNAVALFTDDGYSTEVVEISDRIAEDVKLVMGALAHSPCRR